VNCWYSYCNAVFASLPKITTVPLQHVQNIAAILILHLAPHDHVTTALLHLRYLFNTGFSITSVYTNALHLYPQGTILFRRHCHSDCISQFSWMASVRQQLLLSTDSNLFSAVSHVLHQPPGTLPPSLQQLT